MFPGVGFETKAELFGDEIAERLNDSRPHGQTSQQGGNVYSVICIFRWFSVCCSGSSSAISSQGWANRSSHSADGFIKLIKMLLAPIIFGTIVVGIARMGNLKEVGRVGIKALIYFEIVSTLALVIGLVVVNVMKPGVGMNVDPATLDTGDLATYTSAAKSPDVVSFFMDIIPTSIADAFVKGNMLQVILFSVLFGLALAQLPDRGRLIVEVIDSVLHGLFGIVRFIMRLAPLAALGAMAFTVGKYGPGTLRSFGQLIGCVYLTSLVFIVIVLGGIARMNRISLWKFLDLLRMKYSSSSPPLRLRPCCRR